MSLRDAWHDAADDWIRWARSPEHDHWFWRVNLPSLLELLPPPGRLTVDVGGGEGRVARELRDRGYRVVLIEQSEALAAAAREADPAMDVRVADAVAMPLEDGAADLAVASLSLLNMDDMGAAIAEVARVLGAGGRFVFNVPHPMASAAKVGSYFEETVFAETRERGGSSMTFHDTHRPLSSYFDALGEVGLVVEALAEPRPSESHLAPISVVIRALKPPPA